MPLKPKTTSNNLVKLEHQRLTSLINSMGDAVIAVDETARVVLYNAAALNLLDLNTILTGTTVTKLLKTYDQNHQLIDMKLLVMSAKTPITNRDYLLGYSDGSFINLYMSIAPVRLGYGTEGQKGYVILLRDISREKSLEEERDEFISVVSHELRTPITIAEGNISNALFIAEQSSDITSVKESLKQAHTQVLFLADMINDLATLSRAERGVLKVDTEKINVSELLAELKKTYEPQATAKGLALKSISDPKLEVLNSSRLYVKEILQNFITNSIKYTDKGSVTIKVKTEPKGVKFQVIDTGIGISKSDQEKVFDKFFRSEDFRTRAANGTGLGLYVTMKLARLIKAEVDLDSELNHGSTFTIYIPDLG